MTAPQVHFDVSNFKKMSKRVQSAIKESAEDAVKIVTQDLSDKIADKLAGPHYGYKKGVRGGYVPNYPEGGGEKGKIPIPRLSGNLARAKKVDRLTTFCYAIWMDNRIAKYAKIIHDGAKGRPPRRFLKDTFDEREAANKRTMKSLIGRAIKNAQ